MSIKPHVVYPIAGTLLLVIGLIVSFLRSPVVTNVSIKLIDGVEEHRDHSVGIFGKEHELPDYRVKLNIHRRFSDVDLGTRLNVSAVNWIDFPVNERVFVPLLQEIIVVEDDKLENDVLDRFPISKDHARGTKYECKVTSTRTWDGSLTWFVQEPTGLGVLVISLALIVSGPVAKKRRESAGKDANG